MSEELTNNQISEFYSEPEFQEMIEAGVFYGRKSTKTHPRMKSYVFRTYNNMEAINLNRTKEGLEEALKFLKEKIRNGASVLLAGTQPGTNEIISKTAKEFDFPAVVNRWLGGTLTNFKVISGRIGYYKKLKAEAERGELEKYTKRERMKINEEIGRLERIFGTLVNYNSLPDAVVMIDPVEHKTAVREARRLKIPIIALANTDADPDLIDYLVVGNSKARKSVSWFMEKISEAIREARNLPMKTSLADDASSEEKNTPAEGISETNEKLVVE